MTKEVNKIDSSAQDDKKIESTDLIETYKYGTSKELICTNEDIKCKSMIKPYKKWLCWCYKRKLPTNSWFSMQNINNWRLWIWKTNGVLNLIKQQDENDKDDASILTKFIYTLRIQKKQNINILLKNVKTLVFNTVKIQGLLDDIYESIEEYNPNKERKILNVLDITADILSNKKLQQIVPELFIRGWKLNTSLLFITQSYFPVPKKD